MLPGPQALHLQKLDLYNSHDGLNFNAGNMNKIFHYSYRNSILKLVRLQNSVRNVVKYGIYSPAKIANFV